jgi:hypothetical protein
MQRSLERFEKVRVNVPQQSKVTDNLVAPIMIEGFDKGVALSVMTDAKEESGNSIN